MANGADACKCLTFTDEVEGEERMFRDEESRLSLGSSD
jgi:hypothetical protein